MPRFNLYLSESIHRQVKSHPDVNWSFVAQMAFNKHLQEMNRGNKETLSLQAEIAQMSAKLKELAAKIEK